MRTIKFRGKDNHGTWRYGYLVILDDNPAIYFQVGNGEVKRMDWVYVKPESVGQFTGLHDKDGKEIYEGDVIEAITPYGEPTTYRVIYNERTASFRAECHSWQCYINPIWINECGFSVIGNIHDNPELMN